MVGGYYSRMANFNTIINSIAENAKLKVAHGSIDGLYLSDSLFNYGFDVSSQNLSSADAAIDHFLSNPTDLAITIPVAVVMLTLSILANTKSHEKWKEKGVKFHDFVRKNFPYFRAGLSGIKNGRNAVVNVGLLLSTTAYHFANPIGIAVGALLAANLIWYRHMDQKRLQMNEANDAVIEMLKSLECKKVDDDTEFVGFLAILTIEMQKIVKQSKHKSRFAYVSAIFDGLTDGVYLYGCLFLVLSLGLVSFPPALLAVAIAVIAVVTVLALINKVVDEHQKQQQHKITYYEAKIAVLEKKQDVLEARQIHSQEKIKTASDDTKSALESKMGEVNNQIDELSKKLISKKSKLKSLQHEYKPASVFGKVTYAVLRGLITGAKYARMAAIFVGDGIKSVVKYVLAGIAMAFYIPYLAIRNYKESKANVGPVLKKQGFFKVKEETYVESFLKDPNDLANADFSGCI